MNDNTKKPDDEGLITFADFLVIRDKLTKKVLQKTRGK